MRQNIPDSSQLWDAAERLGKYAESLTAAAQGIREDSDLLFGFGSGEAAAHVDALMKQIADELNEKSRILGNIQESLENTLRMTDFSGEAAAAARF